MATVARRLLEASPLCALSTVSPRGVAHVNTAYFGWESDFRLVWLSDPRARHSRNIRAGASVAVAVFDSHQTWGEPDRGIQLFGTAGLASGKVAQDAGRIYAARFPSFVAEEYGSYRLYVFRPRRMKLFDEAALGVGVFVTASVGAGGRLTWIRTEIYRAR